MSSHSDIFTLRSRDESLWWERNLHGSHAGGLPSHELVAGGRHTPPPPAEWRSHERELRGSRGVRFATINIAAAVVPPATAHFANGMLYLFFSVGALVAPLIVQRIGAKRSLIAGMSFYCFFMAGYIVHTRPVLVLGASVGGFAGAVLWVAQGVYFTANAQVYDETASVARQRPLPQQATQPLQEQRQAQQRWSSNLWTQKATNSITTFAGIFAFTFQLVTTVAKPTAWILLTAYPRNIEVLFGAFTAVAVLCTISMVFVAPMGATDQSSGVLALVVDWMSLCFDWRALLLTPYNMAFGLTTAFSPPMSLYSPTGRLSSFMEAVALAQRPPRQCTQSLD